MDTSSLTRRWKTRRLPAFEYTNPDHAYFLTLRSRETTDPFTDDALAEIVVEALHWLRAYRQVHLYVYCLMPDHLHLLLRPESSTWTVGQLMATFKSFTTKRAWGHGWSGTLWQARFYDHILRRSEDGWAIAEYIRQNPVRRGLVAEAEEYRYSGMPDPLEGDRRPLGVCDIPAATEGRATFRLSSRVLVCCHSARP